MHAEARVSRERSLGARKDAPSSPRERERFLCSFRAVNKSFEARAEQRERKPRGERERCLFTLSLLSLSVKTEKRRPRLFPVCPQGASLLEFPPASERSTVCVFLPPCGELLAFARGTARSRKRDAPIQKRKLRRRQRQFRFALVNAHPHLLLTHPTLFLPVQTR